ncbi:MAG: histidine--tRNA ligase, partial [Verrucomicrobiota bacterium]
MKKTSKPARGTRDILPAQAELRAHALLKISEAFQLFGFQRIETPTIENIQNLRSGDGGENETLVFQILKRGDKLNLNEVNEPGDLVDLGLRYDLTLPLARMVANNRAELPPVFRSLQIGPVWRAERPQKGRFREFVQCDADVIGDASNVAEIELIMATSTALCSLGLRSFKVRINDRRLLGALGKGSNFSESEVPSLLIALDKLDKIGAEGVTNELIGKGFPEDQVKSLLTKIELISNATSVDEQLSHFHGIAEDAVIERLRSTLQSVRDQIHDDSFSIEFDPTLVRGMGYYTGQIFEIGYKDYPFSIAGGGRYDGMISSFGARSEPACGFSIGFERIVTVLEDEGVTGESNSEKILILYETEDQLFKNVSEFRQKGKITTVARKGRNFKNQLEQYKKLGFSHFGLMREG